MFHLCEDCRLLPGPPREIQNQTIIAQIFNYDANLKHGTEDRHVFWYYTFWNSRAIFFNTGEEREYALLCVPPGKCQQCNTGYGKYCHDNCYSHEGKPG